VNKFELINDIETNLDINNLRYKDFNPWPYIKLKLFTYNDWTKSVKNHNNDKNYKAIKINYFIRLIKSGWKYFQKPIKKENKDILYFTRDIETDGKVNNKNFNKFSDSLIELNNSNFSFKVLEMSNGGFSEDTFNNEITYIDFLLKIQNIKSKLLFKKGRSKLNDSLSKCLEELHSYNYDLDKNSLEKDLFNLNKLSLLFENILKKYNPKVVFLVCFYRFEAMALSLACNRLGINVVDYQHGVLDLGMYKYTENIPSKGFELLPNFFLNWHEDDVNYIDSWAKNTSKHKSILGSNFWLSYNVANASKERLKDNTKLNILITLQGDSFFVDQILNFLQVNHDKYNFYIRDHKRFPISSSLKNKLEEFSYENINKVTEMNIYDLLKLTDIHFTSHSTVSLEALSYRIPTIFYGNVANDYFNHLLKTIEGLFLSRDISDMDQNISLALNCNVDKYYNISNRNDVFKLLKKLTIEKEVT